MKKYELLKEEYITEGEVTLYRIRALKDFSNFKQGDLGGYVEDERNLSQLSNAWVSDNAKVFGDAVVRGNALLYGNAVVSGNAEIFGEARVYDNAKISGYSWVYENSKVFGDAEVRDKAWVSDNALVFDQAKICDNAQVFGDAQVYEKAKIFNNALVYGKAKICGETKMAGSFHSSEDDGECFSSDMAWFNSIDSDIGIISAYKTQTDEIRVLGRTFSGSLKEFKKFVKEKHGDGEVTKQYKLMIKLIKEQFKLDDSERAEQLV